MNGLPCLSSHKRILMLLQTELTQIRLLLLERPDEGLLCLLKLKYDISVTTQVTQIRLLLLERPDEGLLCLLKLKYDISVTTQVT